MSNEVRLSKDLKEVSQIFEEHYYSLGIESGHEALGNILEDWFAGRLDDNLKEWNVAKKDFPRIIMYLSHRFIENNKMWKSYEDFHASRFLARQSR